MNEIYGTCPSTKIIWDLFHTVLAELGDKSGERFLKEILNQVLEARKENSND
jgi:hypothetical protein